MIEYPITEIFWSLQGEGHFVGYPMVFIRLAGCSLWGSGRCRIAEQCDTEPTNVARRHDAGFIAREAKYAGPGGIAVITGGEPTDYNLQPLVAALRNEGMRVHLETSGEREVVGLPFEWITVSPKTFGYKWRSGHTLKLIVTPGMTMDEVVGWNQDTQFLHRYLQPLTGPDGLPVNLAEVQALLKHPANHAGKWALSTQAHRVWGMR